MVTIAIDLGGTIIKTGLLRDSKLITTKSMNVEAAESLSSNFPKIESIINQLLAENNVTEEELMGIGISFPGIVDSEKKKVLSTLKKYDDAIELDMPGWASQKWGIPLFIENDARAALLGEWKHGAGVGYEDILMITLGTGIGTASMIEGKLLKGKHFQAGNLGSHITVNYSGEKCPCGNIGCMESESSSWRLPNLIRSSKGFENSLMRSEKLLDYEALFRNAALKDPVACKVLDHIFLVWASGIISMIHAFDPEIIILSGGIMKSAEVIVPELQKRVDKYAWTDWGKVKLFPAKNINSAALFGVDYLVQSSVQRISI